MEMMKKSNTPCMYEEGEEKPVTPIPCKMCTNTMATASLRMDSPNTSVYTRGSALTAPMMESVATGSVAEMSAPNVYASRDTRKSSASSSACRNHPACPASWHACAMTKVVRMVPMTAKRRIVARLLKKKRRETGFPPEDLARYEAQMMHYNED